MLRRQAKYDESRWPVLVVTMPPEPAAAEEFERQLDAFSGYYRRNQRFGIVIDVRNTAPISAEQRRRIAERMDRDAETVPDVMRAVAYVVSSGVHRGVGKAVSWLARRPFPLKFFAELDPAVRWVHGRVAQG